MISLYVIVMISSVRIKCCQSVLTNNKGNQKLSKAIDLDIDEKEIQKSDNRDRINQARQKVNEPVSMPEKNGISQHQQSILNKYLLSLQAYARTKRRTIKLLTNSNEYWTTYGFTLPSVIQMGGPGLLAISLKTEQVKFYIVNQGMYQAAQFIDASQDDAIIDGHTQLAYQSNYGDL